MLGIFELIHYHPSNHDRQRYPYHHRAIQTFHLQQNPESASLGMDTPEDRNRSWRWWWWWILAHKIK
jgi:hypothetical protein